MLLTGVAPLALAAEGTPRPTSLEELKQQRKKAAHRQRRIIFNNDGDDVCCESSEATPEALLAARTSALAGSHVDAIFYCSVQTFGMALHDSRVLQVKTSTEGVYGKNIVQELIAQGTDALKIMVAFGHRHGMEVFWSMRMNDVHEGDASCSYMMPEWKKKHPESLFGTPQRIPPALGDGRAWCAVDYGRVGVRDLAFRSVEEVCERYDVDGVELDFFRHPFLFKRQGWGEPIRKEELEIMTSWMRRVRDMADAVGLKRGRPVLIAVRVPDSIGYCNAIGIDLPQWLKGDLLDLLIVSGYFRLTHWEDSVALGHTYGVPVYPSLDESRVQADTRRVRNSLESYRARAMQAWTAGADGIYLFNLFNPSLPHWRELGDREKLEKLDKLYCVAARGFSLANAYLPGGDRFATRPTLCPERPVTLTADRPCDVTVRVGDAVFRNRQGNVTAQVTLSLELDGLADAKHLGVIVNGNPVTERSLAGGWLDAPIQPEWIRQGANTFGIRLAEPGKVSLKDLQLKVRYSR
jgi:catechol 2,3-dioxygenase-like lactoylglutathione lyase family enzyme